MEQVRNGLLVASALVLAVLILAVLVRAILGPRFTDRIIAVNVINTLVVALLVVLSVWMSEDFLVDVALIYALLSFLTVVCLPAGAHPAAEAQGGPAAGAAVQGHPEKRRRRAWYIIS